MDGRYCAKDARQMTMASGMTTPMNHSPFEVAIQTGRIHEREDVLTYLTSLAVSLDSEEMWEAVEYIKDGKHKRSQ